MMDHVIEPCVSSANRNKAVDQHQQNYKLTPYHQFWNILVIMLKSYQYLTIALLLA